MANLYRQFIALLPDDQLMVATVDAHNADGTSTVTLLGGGTTRVRGTSVGVGLRAFIENGQVQGQAPSLVYYELELT